MSFIGALILYYRHCYCYCLLLPFVATQRNSVFCLLGVLLAGSCCLRWIVGLRWWFTWRSVVVCLCEYVCPIV